jgi:hypothetical protein
VTAGSKWVHLTFRFQRRFILCSIDFAHSASHICSESSRSCVKRLELPLKFLCRVAWSFKDDDNVWQLQGLTIAGVSFGLHVSHLLEDAFQRRELGNILLKLGKHTYSYDQGGTTQTNTKASCCWSSKHFYTSWYQSFEGIQHLTSDFLYSYQKTGAAERFPLLCLP